MLGTETWLNTQYSNNQIIRNFQIHRRDRNSKGGGVLAAVRKGYKSLRRMEFESDVIEDIAIELIVNDIIILLITCYIPPNNTIDLSKCFEDKFKSFEIQFNQYSHVLIFGDFNVNFLPNNNGIVSKAAFNLKNIFSSFGFNQIIERYTYPTNSLSHNKKSILDLLFVNNTKIINSVQIVENVSQSCDHFAIYTELILQKRKVSNIRKKITIYTEENLEKFNEKLYAISWDSLISDMSDINSIFETMLNTFNKLLENFQTNKTVIIRDNTYPKYILKLIHKK